MSNGTRFRVPRKLKKLRTRLYAGAPLSARQRALLNRMLVMKPNGWKGVRRQNIHVAMGDTTTLRRREREMSCRRHDEHCTCDRCMAAFIQQQEAASR